MTYVKATVKGKGPDLHWPGSLNYSAKMKNPIEHAVASYQN